MASKIGTVSLKAGVEIPALGFGTAQGTLETAALAGDAVKDAIDAGFRLIDCAMIYANEVQVGDGIKAKLNEGVVTREELFIVSKLWIDSSEESKVVEACKKSLQDLQLSYLDLYLIHWPWSTGCGDFVDTWRGMEECVHQGLVRNIGVSNFNIRQMTRLLENCSIDPVVNQIEAHINLNQKKLKKFCTSKSIVIMAYSPLGSPGHDSAFQPKEAIVVIDTPVIEDIAQHYKKTNYQVALRYLVDTGMIPIPRSTKPEHIRENLDIFDFKLTKEEITAIEELDTDCRTCTAAVFKDNPEYPFETTDK